MKQILIILGLFASVTTFAQSPRIKLNQITKDTVKGSVLISSPSDSGMVYSRDFYIAYGADTVLILYGDTLGGVGGGFASVLSDGVTITGDGTTGNELKVDTSTVVSTIQGLIDSLANYVTIAGTETITGAKTFTSDLNVDAKIALNAGGGNVVVGSSAGVNLVSGQAFRNVLVGSGAGAAIDSGDNNIAIGYQALYTNTTGNYNVANGRQALYSNTEGENNVANGYSALYDNTIGDYNVANGSFALYSNTTGNYNVANGYQALYYNTTGDYNIANGFQALYSNTTGSSNVANGYRSLYPLSSGSDNQAYGYEAGRFYGSGTNALTTANGSLFLGNNTRASADSNTNEIVIGTDAIGNGNNSVTIGNDGTIGTATSKVVINGVGTTGGTNSALYITSGGELSTSSSDQRLKTNINPLDSELNTLMNLNPVRYNYFDDLENDAIGFIAQELEIYYPNLVFTNPVSNYKGVHYHLFAPILVKAIQEQQSEIQQLKNLITDLTNRLIILENK